MDLTLDRPGWSLVHEIWDFPPLPAAVARGQAGAPGGARGLLRRVPGRVALERLFRLGCLPFNGVDTGSSFGATAYFVPFFVLGILLARQREAVLASLGRRSVPCRAVLWTLAVYGMIGPVQVQPATRCGRRAFGRAAASPHLGQPCRAAGAWSVAAALARARLVQSVSRARHRPSGGDLLGLRRAARSPSHRHSLRFASGRRRPLQDR